MTSEIWRWQGGYLLQAATTSKAGSGEWALCPGGSACGRGGGSVWVGIQQCPGALGNVNTTQASPGEAGPFSLRTMWIHREVRVQKSQALLSCHSNSFVTQKLWGSPHRHPSSSGPSVTEEEVSPWAPHGPRPAAQPRLGRAPARRLHPGSRCRLQGQCPTPDPLLASVLLYSQCGHGPQVAFPSLALSQSSPSRVTPAGGVPTWPHRGVRRAPPRVVQASGEAWRSRPFTRA